MRTTFSISFYCRQSKCNQDGLAPLEMSICINQQRLFLNLPQKFFPQEFNRKRRPPVIDSILSSYRNKTNAIVEEILANDLPLTAATLRQYLRTGGVKSKTCSEMWEDHLKMLGKRVGVSMTPKTFKKWETTRDTFLAVFAPTKEISTLSHGDMVSFYEDLRRKYMDSTASGIMTKVKSVLSYAQSNGFMKTNPASTIKIVKGITKVEYLTEEELVKIEQADLGGYGYLERARDILLFDAYGGGMAYCDLIAFDPTKLIKQGSVYTYSAKRKKTGVPFTTVLLPKAISILQRYDVLPFISNQRLNAYAKEIAACAHIEKNLHAHLFRKTYATLLRQHGVNIETIARCLGHTTSAITIKTYAFAEECTIGKEVENCFK